MTRVAIIGGGIGGLTAANALSRAGIETAVYEAAAELREIGAGVALHPNAMKVLRAIGVEDGVRTVAGRSQWQVMRNWKTGRVIGRTSRQQQEASFGIPGATVHRADLLDVLAHALPAGLVTLGKRCTQVRPDGDVAVARFATAARSRPTSSWAPTESTHRCAPACSARTTPGSPGRSAIAASSGPKPSAASVLPPTGPSGSARTARSC